MKLVYDATHVAAGIRTAGRTGIYFVAYNILAELIKRTDIELTLYCEGKFYYDLMHELELHFPEENFKIISNVKAKKIAKLHYDFYIQKKQAKEKGQKFLKTILQFKLLLMSIILKIDKLFHRNYTKYDAFLSPMYKIPNKMSNTKMLKFLILYDVIPLVLDDYLLCGWFKDVYESLNSRDYYFAISDSAKNEFLKHCPIIDANKIKTILLACNETFKPTILTESIKKKYNIPLNKKYVFSLCTLEPRKNLVRTVKAFIEFIKKNNIEDMVFVLGGGHWEKFITIIEQEIVNLGDYKKYVVKAGYVDDEDLAPLYSGAEWFTFTSQYEGFGLPPLEAMSCGCPVITSNNTSLPEVVGDAGIMIDWDSDEQHIEAYEKYYYNEELRKEYAQKGLERSKQFSWKKCTEEIISEIRSTLY